MANKSSSSPSHLETQDSKLKKNCSYRFIRFSVLHDDMRLSGVDKVEWSPLAAGTFGQGREGGKCFHSESLYAWARLMKCLKNIKWRFMMQPDLDTAPTTIFYFAGSAYFEVLRVGQPRILLTCSSFYSRRQGKELGFC